MEPYESPRITDCDKRRFTDENPLGLDEFTLGYESAMRELDALETRMHDFRTTERFGNGLLGKLLRKSTYAAGATVMGAYLVFANFYTTNGNFKNEQELPTPTRQFSTLHRQAQQDAELPRTLEEHLRGVKLEVGQHLVVIDPSRDAQLENVYQVTLKKIESHKVSTGKNSGPKQRPGDYKTPENNPGEVFRVESVEESSGRADPFDNIVGAYGPYFVRFDTPERRLARAYSTTGRSSFGLHGTLETHKIGTPASHGCVRHRNEDILGMVERGLVTIGTPLVIRSGILTGKMLELAPGNYYSLPVSAPGASRPTTTIAEKNARHSAKYAASPSVIVHVNNHDEKSPRDEKRAHDSTPQTGVRP